MDTIFAKLLNKNAKKHQKDVPSPKNFHNPHIPSLPKFGKNFMDPPMDFQTLCIYVSHQLDNIWIDFLKLT